MKRLLLLGTFMLVCCFVWSARHASAETDRRVVRIAELQIDPDQLETYKAALRVEIETSVRVEPGVLTLHAVSVRDDLSKIRIFEVYADHAAYQAHLETPHFKKYKTATQAMIKSLKLIETEPIILGEKGR